jgi:peptidyl-prolyl cis-trans isomerase A (cyclophilin A)
MVAAAEARNADRLADIGGELDHACESCHVKFWYPTDALQSEAPRAARPPGLYARFETNMGSFTAELFEKDAPETVANFADLADGLKAWTDPRSELKQRKPLYDGLIFHRIIAGFMIQGGDPLGDGTGGPGFTISDEPNNRKHTRAGTLAMARSMEPDSAGSQFYITVEPTTFLDGQRPPYVVFGQIVEGLDVVVNISKVKTDRNDRPLEPVTIRQIRTERIR